MAHENKYSDHVHPLDLIQSSKKNRSCPTLQELGKHLAPPGSTPNGSATDISAPHSSAGDGIPSLRKSRPNKSETFDPIMLSPRRRKETSDVNNNFAINSELEIDVPPDIRIPNEVWENVGESLMPLSPSKRAPRDRFSVAPNIRLREPYRVVSSSGSESSRRSNLTKLRGVRSGGDGYEYDYEPSNATESLIFPKSSLPSTSFRKLSHPMPHLKNVISELQDSHILFDRNTAIKGLKARILRGENVSHDEINAIKSATLPPHQRHLGFRLPWTKDIFCHKGLVFIPTPGSPPPKTGNSFGSMDHLRIPTDDRITMEHFGRRQYILSLAGFADEDITLYLEGKNRLVIRAARPDRGKLQGMVVTETILLPPDLPADNLRIVRNPSGTTIIEESWRF